MGLNNGRVFNLATMTLEQLKQDLLTEWEREVRGASDRMLPQDQQRSWLYRISISTIAPDLFWVSFGEFFALRES